MTEYIISIETESGVYYHNISVSNTIKHNEFLEAYTAQLIKTHYKDQEVTHHFDQSKNLNYL